MLSVNSSNQNQSEMDFIFKEYLTQIYIMDSSGIVRYARLFNESTNIEPQLLGSFLSALEAFVDVTSQKMQTNDIKLLDIGTSHSRWFLKKSRQFLFVLLVPNSSMFLKNEGFSIVYDMLSDLMTSFFFHHENYNENGDLEISSKFEEEVNYLLMEKINSFTTS